MVPTSDLKIGIFSKASGDCGGGGSFHTSELSSSKRMMYEATKVLSINHEGYFEILKDRGEGNKGKIPLDEAINHIADMLAKVKFGNSMDMFQEGTKIKLIEVINEVLSGKNIIPKGAIDYENTVQPESGGNGSGRNTLLQRFVQLRR